MNPGLSIADLVMSADPVVKAVMAFLLLASVACWAVVFDKFVKILKTRRSIASFATQVRSDTALGQPMTVEGVPAAVLAAGHREWRERDEGETRTARRERIERAMRFTMIEELRKLEPGLPLLATVGSAAPFVGLFGTVWGIMNSFTAIAQTNDTSLSVVAPGIAEALFATALGLFAAIPAVIAYNKLSTDLTRLGQRLGSTINEVSSRLACRPATMTANTEAAE